MTADSTDAEAIGIVLRGAYPPTLSNMDSPPASLYVRGRFPAPDGQRYLCVVGSRRWTRYGKDAAHRIISGLRGYPISIVSGLAVGIDSIAHEAALEAGLHCVAFPGSSLEWDEIYPRENVGLAREIVRAGGALLSQWGQGYPTGKWSFPARNILMAGLSDAVMVVEAGRRSGSLMTAQHAEKQGRDVLAVPGPIEAANSYGPHMLIRRGAGLAASADDVLEALGFPVVRGKRPRAIDTSGMDPLSAAIIAAALREEATVSMLIERSGARPSAVSEKLSLLELKGLIIIENGVVSLA
ncbi:MAG: DNA-processing protein DprA [Patescibacteria group bacterium]|nr:DNA-processing protein DprA [Patescibacteria group bacterium]